MTISPTYILDLPTASTDTREVLLPVQVVLRLRLEKRYQLELLWL